MLLSSKNGGSGGIKTFEVFSSYITLASNIFKQTSKVNLCYGLYHRKSVTFLNQGTFSLSTSMPTMVNVNALVVATVSWWLHFSAQVVA